MSGVVLLVIGAVAAWLLLSRDAAPASSVSTQASQDRGTRPNGIMYINPQFGVNTEGPALHPDLPAPSSTPIVVPIPSNIAITGTPGQGTSGGFATQADPSPGPTVYNSPGATADALVPDPGGVDTLVFTGTRPDDGTTYRVFRRPNGDTYTV